jgi:alcohol dehydrogenase class IV
VKKTYYGPGCLQNLSAILDHLEACNVFLVTGASSFRTSGAETYFVDLASARSIKLVRFVVTTKSPNIKTVSTGFRMFCDSACDLIIGVGGGNIIDIAKLINEMGSNKDLQNLGKVNSLYAKKSPVPLVAIPTTSGSGSEATQFAVLYIKKIKQSVSGERIKPAFALIDPLLTLSLSSRNTALGGIDAFCQAVEAFWSVRTNSRAQRYAGHAIALIRTHLESAVHKPELSNKSMMSLAAHLAGRAINIAQTTAAHALSYPLTAHYDVEHGQAVCLFLPDILMHNSSTVQRCSRKISSHLRLTRTMSQLYAMLGTNDPKAAADEIRRLVVSVGLSTSLSELGINHIRAKSCLLEQMNFQRLRNNPVPLDKTDVIKILNNIR